MGISAPHSAQGCPSPLAPGTPPQTRHDQRSTSPARQPWVSAEWKHRVPETKNHHCTGSAAPLCPHTQHRANLVAEHKRQLAAEFAGAHSTIERMLARCKLVQDTPHVNSSSSSSSSKRSGRSSGGSSGRRQPSQPGRPKTAAPGSEHAGMGMHLTLRSQLLFEAPAAAAQQAQAASSSSSSSSGVGGRGVSSSSGSGVRGCSCAAQGAAAAAGRDVQQQHDRQQHTAWDGAVDLNPGFWFRPGTPERTAAVLRHAGQQAVLDNCSQLPASAMPVPLQGAAAAAFQLPVAGGLTHREYLQAGIQELNGVFYQSIRQQQWQHHQQQLQLLGQQAETIPVSWFGV